MKTTLDTWSDICQSLFGDSPARIHPIHSCVIDNKPHYIHAPDLSERDPTYFKQLAAFAEKHHIQLKADKRRANTSHLECRRRRLLPILFLAFGATANFALADEDKHETYLHLFSKQVPFDEHAHPIDTQKSGISFISDTKTETARRIEQILTQHLEPQGSDPNTLFQDMRLLANYYAKHEEAVKLIDSLDGKDWTLNYAPHTFQTNVRGTRMRVDDVKVFFDPRSGAKLKFYDKCNIKKPFCVASPADALLHELLHVQTILLDTDTFIAQGGLGRHMYPMEHERQTILKENAMYKSMSLRDNKPRPIRNEHSGRHVLVSCVTCIE